MSDKDYLPILIIRIYKKNIRGGEGSIKNEGNKQNRT